MVEATAVKKTTRKAQAAPKAAPKSAPKEDSKVFAVFATGGKQYKVKIGNRIKIEKLSDPSTSSGQVSYKEGDSVSFDNVLLVDNGSSVTLGTPFIKGGEVKATISKIGRNKKIEVIKYKQKSRYFKRYGHRQPYFEVRIDSIK